MNSGYSTIASSDFGHIDASAQSSLGAISTTDDSRKFRYVKFANAAAINAGVLVYKTTTTVAATVLAGQAGVNTTAGSKYFVAKLGAAVTAGQLDGGFVAVTAPSGSYSLRVKSVGAGASAANVTVELDDFVPDGLDLSTATALSFTSNPYVVTTSTAGTGADAVALGTTINQIPAQTTGVYAYVQTNGVNLAAASEVAE